jgi:NADH-quinone oxidoreductase subunit H
MERKTLAAVQRRRGPNEIGFFGLAQAIADALKLLSKETIIPSSSNYIFFIISPMFTFFLSFVAWSVIPFDLNCVIADINLGILFIFAISSLGVYGILLSGWSSNSKYALLGGLRSAAQPISYEISIGLIVMPVIVLSNSTNLTQIVLAQTDIFFIIPLFPSFVLFFISILAETNRTPFDLPEAESELVSGFNVEYSAIGFTLFFLAEYSNIILTSSLMTILFLGG